MSQHTSPPRYAVAETNSLPGGRAGLVALASQVGGLVYGLLRTEWRARNG